MDANQIGNDVKKAGLVKCLLGGLFIGIGYAITLLIPSPENGGN